MIWIPQGRQKTRPIQNFVSSKANKICMQKHEKCIHAEICFQLTGFIYGHSWLETFSIVHSATAYRELSVHMHRSPWGHHMVPGSGQTVRTPAASRPISARALAARGMRWSWRCVPRLTRGLSNVRAACPHWLLSVCTVGQAIAVSVTSFGERLVIEGVVAAHAFAPSIVARESVRNMWNSAHCTQCDLGGKFMNF